MREARADELLGKLGDAAPHGGGSTDLSAIGLALVERKVRALFVAEGAYIPGGFDEETGEVFLFEREPHGRFQGPELADAFARAALAQDAEVFELAPEKIPGDSGMARAVPVLIEAGPLAPSQGARVRPRRASRNPPRRAGRTFGGITWRSAPLAGIPLDARGARCRGTKGGSFLHSG